MAIILSSKQKKITSLPGTEDVPHRQHYGPLAFWCLNHLLETGQLAAQIKELKKRGYAGFFMHPRAGLLTPYGSTEWFDAVGFCIRTAKEMGIQAWLYDEDGFPSGMAGGRTTMDHPEWRASFLRATVRDVAGAGRYYFDLPKGQFIGAFLVQGKEIRNIDKNAGLVRTDWTSIGLANHNYYPPFSAHGAPHWRTDAEGQHYRVTADIEGKSTFVAFTRQYATHRPWGEYADLLNPVAVDSFIELTHVEYFQRFGHEFGKTIPGIFTDEPKAVGTFPWSESLFSIFASLTGESLVSCLPHLILDVDDRTVFRRWAYRESISLAFKTAYIDRIAEFCSRVGLTFVGHISPEEDPIGQAVATPGLMSWIGGMTIPGTDLIGAEIGDECHKIIHLGPKLASSAAHTRGKTDVLCEAFAVVDWVQNTAWMGKTINWLYALGVNLLTTHGQFYSIDGPRKREAPPSQFIQASYWEHFGAISEYVSNLSRELTAGHHAAPVALYYPSEAFMALAPSVNCEPAPTEGPTYEAARLRDILAEIIDLLLVSGFDFDLVDAQSLAVSEITQGRLKIQNESYSALVALGGWLRKDTEQVFQKLEFNGFPILALQSEMPVLGGGAYRPSSVTTLENLVHDLGEQCIPIFKADGRLIGHKRVAADGARLFLVNNGKTKFHGEVVLDFDGPYEVVDLQNGDVCSIEEPLTFELAAGRGVLVRQSKKSARQAHLNFSDWKPMLDLSTEWACRFESENCLIINEFRMRPGAMTPETSDRDFLSAPFVDLLAPSTSETRNNMGDTVCFWTSFDCCNYHRPLYLVRDSQLGPPAHSERSDNFRFFINGQLAPDFHRHQRYDPYNLQSPIERLVREGRNFLVMEQTLPPGHSSENGMPYDCVRLFGDFHIDIPFGRTSPALIAPRPNVYPIGLPTLVQQMGHPHYGGIAVYSRQIDLDELPGRLAVRFDKLHESAEILVNSRSVGFLWQEPSLLEIDRSFWKVGLNHIEIRCSTSPANYLQALSCPSGFSGRVTLEGCPPQ